jgi:putative endonuclease
MNYVVYILLCNDGTLYTGITNDIIKRLRQHNGEIVGGAKYTRARRPCNIMYFKQCLDRSSACKEEYRIKKLKRKDKFKMMIGNI